MRKYDLYKDTGVEWVGGIPKHWGVKKIKHRCYVKARVGWKGLKSDEFLIEGYAYLVTGSDFKNDTVIWKECYQIDQERYEEDPYIQLKEDDLLITKDGTIGKLAIVKELDNPACLNSRIFVVRSTRKDFTTEYLFWILKSNIFTQFNDYTSYGSTIQHLYQNVFVEFSFPFPGITEQTKIAHYLLTKTREIDNLIADKKRLLELYEEEKTAIINQAVTKGINPEVPLKDSGIEWLGEIPKHWEVKRLKYVAKMQGGFAFSSKDFSTKGVQLIKISNLYQNELQLERQSTFLPSYFLETHSDWVVKNGDLLMSMTGTLGKRDYGFAIFIENCEGGYLLNQRVSKIHSVKEIDNRLLLYVLRSEYFLNNLFSLPSGTKQGNFSNENVTDLFITFPEGKQEQGTLIQHIKTECNIVENKINKTKKLIELLIEYRTALINEVVTGKIKVTD